MSYNSQSESSKISLGVDNFQWFGERIMVGRRGAFFVLAVITAAIFHVVGIHGIIAPVVDDFHVVIAIDIAVFFFVFGLEHFRFSLLVKFLDDVLKKRVSGTGIKTITFLMYGLITSVLLSLTIVGAVEGVNWYNFNKQNHYITHSLEYRSAKAEVEAGVKREAIYDERMKQWRADKRAHDADCNAQWSGDFRTKRAECKKNFRRIPSSKDIAVSHEVDISVIKSIESKYKDLGMMTIAFVIMIAIVLDMIAVYPALAEYSEHSKEINANGEIAIQLREREKDKREKQSLYLTKSREVYSKHFEELFGYRLIADKYESHRKLSEFKRIAEAHSASMNSRITDVTPEYTSKRDGYVTVPNVPVNNNDNNDNDTVKFLKAIYRDGAVKKGDKTLPISIYKDIGVGRTVTDRKNNFTFFADILRNNGVIAIEKKGFGYVAQMELEEAILLFL